MNAAARRRPRHSQWTVRGGASQSSSSTSLNAGGNTALHSILAGSLAGAIGVGVSFPLDTVKTKAQTMNVSSMTLGEQIICIWEREGLAGFFGGVRGMMMGQAIIKALAFSANAHALQVLLPTTQKNLPLSGRSRLLAACWAGFVTSFAVTPIERIKVLMQATSSNKEENSYKNELDCLQQVVAAEGLWGLCTRGLGATLLREIPSYGIYFGCFGILSNLPWLKAVVSPRLAPLVFGASSGMLSWLPVYPVDVVKTALQNTRGGNDDSESNDHDTTSETNQALVVIRQLYQQGGYRAFLEGLDAKMLRAGVNHAVTFWVYERTMKLLLRMR